MSGNNQRIISDMPELGRLLKSSMAEQSLSMRKLSKLTGICTASISRIINNKQPARIHHLQEFSKYLNIPFEHLLFAVGIGSKEIINEDSYFIINMIQDIFKSLDMDLHGVMEDIKHELGKYEQYAKTGEGKKVIHNGFMSKITEVNSSGIIIEQLNLLYKMFSLEDIDSNIQAIIGSVLLYFILSADVIPDYVFPIGYLDDAIAVNLVVSRLLQDFDIAVK